MRADRLVAILLMLQSRGQVTAAEVAAELEVSERTARRDLEALGVAGLPVYSRQGRNGGWQLLGESKTDLSGLTADEARALFLVAGPSSAATPEVRAALRKLVRALPEPFRDHAQRASAAVVVDPTSWGRHDEARPAPAHLDAVQRAVIEGCQLRLCYVSRQRVASERTVHPLGLATKGSSWYLVADTDAGLRTFRVDRMTDVTQLADPVVRPEGFDLGEAWKLITAEVDQRRAPLWARGTAEPSVVPLLRWLLGTRVRIGPTDADGRVSIEVGGSHVAALAGEIAGLGGRLHLTEPPEIVDSLARIGAELADLYGGPANMTNS